MLGDTGGGDTFQPLKSKQNLEGYRFYEEIDAPKWNSTLSYVLASLSAEVFSKRKKLLPFSEEKWQQSPS